MPTPIGPTLEAFTSARLTCRNGDLFNPPALTNFLGCLQVAPDITAVQHLTFAPWSMGASWLGALQFDGCRLHASAAVIEFEWRPDRVVRRTEHDGWQFVSTTVMGVRAQTVTVALQITNRAANRRAVRFGLLAGEGVVRSDDGWHTPVSPQEAPVISTTPWEGAPPEATLRRNRREILPDRSGLLFSSQATAAHAL
ncbi:MAG: hypothetical protein QG602_3166, partial [Verrucomicrobiota bacterium]|nr:hypothetical protein [Verrucomicrobiota bacterium]